PTSAVSRARGAELERIADLHATLAGRREADVRNHLRETARDLGVEAGARRALDGARRRDEEAQRDLAAEPGLGEQLLVVAIGDLVEVLADVAPDDRLVVARAGDRRFADARHG